MGSMDADLVALIDARVRAATAKEKFQGTCVSRSSTGPNATVIFDGSSVAMPVKVLGTVFVQPGDRCVLDLYGSQWIVTGSFAASGFGEASWQGSPSGTTGQLTNGSYVDLQEIGPITFDKKFDQTFVRMDLEAGAYVNTSTDTAVRFGLRFTPILTSGAYTAQDYVMGGIYFNQTLTHQSCHYNARAIDIPAGRYSVQIRWRRSNGSGGIQANSFDVFTIELDERVRASVPVL